MTPGVGTQWRRGLPWLLVAAVVVPVAVLAVIHWSRPGVDRFPVRGIDVSHHQGVIDWSGVAEAGLHFAFIKASEGADHGDTRFEENWREAGRIGLVRGAYHFFTFCTPGDAQAEHYLEVVPPAPDVLPPAVDVEFAGNCRAWTSIEDIRHELGVLLDRLQQAWGRAPVLYITRESEDRIIGEHFDAYPRWIRSVYFRPGVEREWLFWQYTDEGEVPGIGTPVDLNVFRGRPEELTALLLAEGSP